VEKFDQATWDLFAEVGMYRRSLEEVMAKAAEHPLVAEIDDE
jgi:hypothetical protein